MHEVVWGWLVALGGWPHDDQLDLLDRQRIDRRGQQDDPAARKGIGGLDGTNQRGTGTGLHDHTLTPWEGLMLICAILIVTAYLAGRNWTTVKGWFR